MLQNNWKQEGKKKANSSMHYYFVGPEERMKEVVDGGSPYGPHVRPAIFQEMLGSLVRTNPIVDRFSRVHEWDAEEVDFHIVEDTEDGLKACKVDVCSVMERPQSSIPGPREIVIFKKNTATGKQKAVAVKTLTHTLYEPLTYPMVFQHGEQGWTLSKQKAISLLEYARGRLFLPEVVDGKSLTYVGGCGASLPCNRLQGMSWIGQQYALDTFCRLEEQRLTYQANNQERLTRGNASATGTFLSKSVRGSQRHLKEQTANALAVMRKLGKPLLFITM